MSRPSSLKLGRTGPEVFPIALGCMGMSGMYGASDEAESIATIHRALERGVNLLDTGDFYGMGHNERLIHKALEGRADKPRISVKFGALRAPDGRWLGVDTRPAAVMNFAAYSLDRLGVEAIDVYRPARLDPNVPIEETMGAIAELIKAGYVRHAGLSEVGVETVRRAHAVTPIADLQIEYAIATRKPEDAIFPALRELGVSATLYGVFSRGLLAGSKPQGPRDYRNYLPRFAGESGAKNGDVVATIKRFAEERGMTAAQAVLSWVLVRQPGFVPVIGARTVKQIDDALDVLDRPLSASDADVLEALVPREAITGSRYAEEQMRHLDSER